MNVHYSHRLVRGQKPKGVRLKEHGEGMRFVVRPHTSVVDTYLAAQPISLCLRHTLERHLSCVFAAGVPK